MANHLMHFDPFGDITRFDPLRTAEDLLREFQPARALREMVPVPPMRLDVTETDQAYTVKAEIPGVKKEDIQVDVVGNRVTVSAEVKREEQAQGQGTVLRNERFFGQRTRSFTLEHEIDDANAKAEYHDGILELTLPKKAVNQTRKLSIQ